MAGINIMLVEDDWIIAKEIGFSLQDFGFQLTGPYDSGEEALRQVQLSPPDIVLLDIGLAGNLSGLEVAQQLRLAQIPFIFLTALADSATIQKAKLSEPYAYLVKPVAPESLYSTIEITLYNASQKKDGLALQQAFTGPGTSESIFVKTKGRLEKVLLKDVLWVEASDIYATLHTGAGRHLLNTSLKVVEEKFPPSSFIRVHRSYLVNISHIDALEDDQVIVSGQMIPVGKTYRDKLMARLSIL